MTPLCVSGLIDRDIAALLTEQLSAIHPGDLVTTIDFTEADIDDAVVVTTLIKLLRETANRLTRLEVVGAPQTIAHGLYRVGALGPNAKLKLIDPREEIGTSS